MKNIHKTLLIGLLPFICMVSCTMPASTSKSTAAADPKVINLDLSASPRSNIYVNLDYGIRLSIKDNRTTTAILGKHDNYVTSKPYVSVNPEVPSFVSESIRRYMRTMGFRLDSDISSDYMMTVSLKPFNVS